MRNNKYESGRSMVEMLGTLAIIGVLSIGGIAGYSYGMDKYRCNQTINDIMLMGVDVITQTSRGVVPTLSEWGTKTTAGYDFSVKPNPTDATKYGIVVDGVPSSVCKMVGDGLKQTVSVYVGNVDYTTANTNPCEASEENTMKFFFETGAVETDGCKTDAECGEGRYCDKDTGICFNGTAPEGSYVNCTITNECCTAGEYSGNKHGNDCSTDTIANGMCYYGTCVAKGCTYDENKCTGKAEYCASPNNSCAEAFQPGKTGTCVEADFAKLDVGGKTYYVSNHYMSWWDADAACKALGREGLVSVNDLVTGWDSYEFTALGRALQSHFGTNRYIWTENLPDEGIPCWVHYVNLNGGSVGYIERTMDSYSYAVCKQFFGFLIGNNTIGREFSLPFFWWCT